MTDLSPAAQAVDDAFWKTINDKWNIYDRCRFRLAAALQAAADQVAPALPESELGDPEILKGIWGERRTIRAELLAIAAELEAP